MTETEFFNISLCFFFLFSLIPILMVYFVIEEEYGADCGEWGKVRELTLDEKIKYYPVFKKLYPDVDMNKVHLVEFCWYNCSEAPGYYSMDKGKDPFYEEVPFICNFTLD